MISIYELFKNNKISYKIYCDLDGVLVDFESKAPLNHTKIDWDKITEIGSTFWFNLPWLKNGKKLWKAIKKYDPIILSSPGHRIYKESYKNAINGKTKWIKSNLGNIAYILCQSNEKMKYAKGNILIDDKKQNIDEWNQNGGIGILYKPKNVDKVINIISKVF